MLFLHSWNVQLAAEIVTCSPGRGCVHDRPHVKSKSLEWRSRIGHQGCLLAEHLGHDMIPGAQQHQQKMTLHTVHTALGDRPTKEGVGFAAQLGTAQKRRPGHHDIGKAYGGVMDYLDSSTQVTKMQIV